MGGRLGIYEFSAPRSTHRCRVLLRSKGDHRLNATGYSNSKGACCVPGWWFERRLGVSNAQAVDPTYPVGPTSVGQYCPNFSGFDRLKSALPGRRTRDSGFPDHLSNHYPGTQHVQLEIGERQFRHHLPPDGILPSIPVIRQVRLARLDHLHRCPR